MSNFTKGTWKYLDSLYRVCAYSKDKVQPKNITGKLGGTTTEEEIHANGRLIAAAPDMYQWIEKACRALLDWRITYRDRTYYGDKAMIDDFAEDFLLLIHSSDLLLDRINENGGDPE